MTDIQRWDMNHVQGEVYIAKNPEGSWVTFADAEAAIDEARSQEAKVHAATERWSPLSYLQGQRDVFAYHPEWTVTDMCKPDCLPCQRLTELITEREKGYEEGQRDAIAAAVQRVEAMTPAIYTPIGHPHEGCPDPSRHMTWEPAFTIPDILAAIKGDQP